MQIKKMEEEIHALSNQALVLDKKYAKQFQKEYKTKINFKNSEECKKVCDLLTRLSAIILVDPLSKYSYTNINMESSRELDYIKDKTGKVVNLKPNGKESSCIKLWSGMKEYKSFGKKIKNVKK